MEIIIHGTKGGYKVLFQTPNVPFSIARDVRRIDGSVGNSVGLCAYSISFADKGCAFTKYLIVRDTERAAVGNIAFSVFIPNNKKLYGKDIKVLLDELETKYRSKYIGISNNLDNVREDWTFVNEVISKYQNIPVNDVDEIQSGQAEAAFVYFSSESELHKYFDAPYQEEYSSFKQIFFVEKDLENKPENPLNALRHNLESNLTGRIDLDNPKYTLLYDEKAKNGVKVEVKTKEKGTWIKRNNTSKIRRKNEILITYKKSCYVESSKQGKWDEIDSEFIIVDVNSQTISIKEINLEPQKNTITIEVIDNKLNPIIDAEISCERNFSKETKIITNSKVTFEAEEIKDKWTVSAKKDIFFGKKEFIPETQNGSIILMLVDPPNFNSGSGQSKQKKYKVSAGEYGALKSSYSNYSNFRDGCDVFNIIVPNKGYELIRFKFENDILIAQYSRKKPFYKKLKFLLGIVCFIAIVVVLYNMFSGEDTKKHSTDPKFEGIIHYCEGIELNEKTLKEYKSTYCEKNAVQQEKEEEGLWSKLFSSKKETDQNEESKQGYCTRINSAIDIRNAINLGKIDELKDLIYSENQKSFKDAIANINDKLKQKIGETIHNHTVSKMNLNEVADFINNLQKLLQSRENLKTLSDKLELEKMKIEIDKNSFPVDSIKSNIISEIEAKIPKQQQQQNKNEDKITKQKQNVQNQQNQQQQSSSQSVLKTKFWNYVHSGNVKKDDYTSLLKEYKKRQSLSQEENDIINFLGEICKNTDNFKKFKDIPEMDRKEAKRLTQIKIN